MNGAWEKIRHIIDQVYDLELASIDAINQIDDVLAEAAIKEAPLYPQAARMTTRAWLALCGCILVMGMGIGWAVRTHTTHDRYMNSLANQHEAAEAYYNSKLINAIADNERSFKRGK